ncbi:CmcI family methyltransferase [Streptomyces sp. NPDC047042]|uniref:CmcI family methyltransferase n=1 Tax=Streptomyces sp. NPDC047042 TaxID=3154807 RepID=UPI00340E31EC
MTIDAMMRRTQDRVDRDQQGIPTYYDRRVLRQAKEQDPEWRARLARHDAALDAGRFVPWPQRQSVDLTGLDPHRRSEIPDDVLIMSQGTARPTQWRGHNLFKSAFDFALVPMLLAELRPAVILEVGSGNGASALWMADLAELHGFACRIVSLDVNPVPVVHPSVEFITGDARRVGEILPAHVLARGPRLVVEDAHVGVRGVLEFVHEQLQEGDYIMVEDSVGKASDLREFTAAHTGAYTVDTHYTDFFGRNATSCVDSILRRMA